MGLIDRVFAPFGLGGASNSQGPIAFADLSEAPDPAALPPLDRPGVDEAGLTPEQRAWRRDGVVILRGFIPDAMMAPYIDRRERLKTDSPDDYRGGWREATSYEHVPELRALALYPPLMRVMEQLIGEPMMLHLALTGWVSTERNWHQDDYLNPEFVNAWYAAAWIALDDIHPDAGPFQYIPGSHAWPLLRRGKVMAHIPQQAWRAHGRKHVGVFWPQITEAFVAPAIEAEIARRGVGEQSFIARRGDVLIWHGGLMHRGSEPRSPDLLRRSLITHYSGISHRPDMRRRGQDSNGQAYAMFGRPLA